MSDQKIYLLCVCKCNGSLRSHFENEAETGDKTFVIATCLRAGNFTIDSYDFFVLTDFVIYKLFVTIAWVILHNFSTGSVEECVNPWKSCTLECSNLSNRPVLIKLKRLWISQSIFSISFLLKERWRVAVRKVAPDGSNISYSISSFELKRLKVYFGWHLLKKHFLWPVKFYFIGSYLLAKNRQLAKTELRWSYFSLTL